MLHSRWWSCHSTDKHLPSLTTSDGTATVCAGGAGDMLGGVHSAFHPAATTVVGILSCVGLTAVTGAIEAVLIPEWRQERQVVGGGLQTASRSGHLPKHGRMCTCNCGY
jgi:hypothetical protein